MRQLKKKIRKENPTTTNDGKKGKRFIERLSDVMQTLKVMSTNQRDPLVTDSNVPLSVLQHIQQRKKNKKKEEQEAAYSVLCDDDYG
ncbi:hypothetical protein Pcinc_037105 [Petrolisthes cinctipes]|uniref:Uncharacterized protein n=1 Tax=Petrolisthes cinctipes TaxID=88211 RepID=A0AAE1BTF6_PETCI|nr:hypothetical protein Pcinc_037105 [Petrolisthes cinctipes]